MGIDFSKFNKGKASARLEAPPIEAMGPRSSIFRMQEFPDGVVYGYDWGKEPETQHVGDFVALLVTNSMNPAVRSGAVEIGDFDYGLEIYTHPGNKNVHHTHVCLQRNYGIKDPRCQEYFVTYVKNTPGTGNQDHRSSSRRYMLWVPRDSAKPEIPGTKAYVVDFPADPKHGFDIIGEAKTGNDDGGPVFFWYPTEDGRTVRFTTSPGQYANSWDYKRIKFVKRPAAVGAALHEKFCFSLDALLIIPTWESMERDIYDAPPEEDDAPPATTTQASKHTEYKREEKEVPDNQRPDPDLDYSKPAPDTDKVPKDEKPTAKVETAKGACPHGLVYGKSCTDKPEPRACKTCDSDVYDGCVAAG